MKKVFFYAALLAMTACGGNTDKTAAGADAPTAEQFAQMQDLYENAEDDHGWMPLCKWQYVDLDGDGLCEVWMRDKSGEYGAMFSLAGGAVSLIGIETDRFGAYTLEQKDGKGFFCKGGSAGGPSFYTEIVTVKDSRVVEPGEWHLLDLTKYDRVPAHENSAKDDKIIKGFITEMYNNGLYNEYDFLEEHCTPRMLQQLRDDYEYDGEGYAIWDFRSMSNDGIDDENCVLSIDKIDGRYYYEAKDSGFIFRNILSAFVQDGKVMLDGIAVDATYDVFDPFAEDEE